MTDHPASDPATWFYRNPRALVLVVGLVVVSGLSSLAVMPRMEDPIIGQRGALVATRMPGADAERIEALITEPLEERLQEVEEIKKITSESRPGISTIQIELREDVDATDEVWSDVRAKLNDTVAELPAEAGRPVFDEIDVRAYALITALVWQRNDPTNWTILRRYAKQLENDFQAISGTEVVDRFADPGEQITVSIDPELAADLGLNVDDVASALHSADVKDSAGILRSGRSDLVIEMANQFMQSDRIGETLIQSGADGEMIRLNDLATITRRTPDPMTRMAMVDGSPAVSLGVLVRPNERLDVWRPKAQAVLDSFRSSLPEGISITIPLDQNEYVDRRLVALAGNLVIGASAVVLVVLILMGWRSAMVVALSLPLSAFSVLFGLRVLGVPIHQMSVTGMIIALGLLIDNAIVAVDEVATAIGNGRRRIDAVREMVHHLAVPLAGSTATTAIAFAPIAMMPGNAGEFVGSISISVILAITASLFFALTVIPVVAARVVVPKSEDHQTSSTRRCLTHGISSQSVLRVYQRSLTWLLAKPARGIAAGILLPIVGFIVATRLPEQFFPPADRDQFHIQLELPVHASIDETYRAASQLTELVNRAGAETVNWYFGESAPMFYYNVINNRRGVPNFANAIVQMDAAEGIESALRDLQHQADKLVPGARVLFRQLEQGPPFDAPIEIRVFGPDLERLTELGDQVRVALAAAPDVIHTKALLNETQPTVTFDVRTADAKMAGLRPSDVSEQLYGLLEGVPAGSVLEDTEQIPILVRVGAARRMNIQSIHTLQVQSDDIRVPIESIADVTLRGEIAVIPRMNRKRMNLISGFITAGTLPSVSLAAFEKQLHQSGFKLPVGYSIDYGGEASQRDDAVGNLMANAGVLGVVMIAVLVLSFGSFRMAGMILVVAVFSGSLGMIGLWVGGYPFGFMAIIGIMGLIGVAINDSIVVLAALQQRSATSLDDVVQTVIRCTRHVVATTCTTIAGFTPLIIDGGEFWPPLAVAIAGGVGGATLLALFFVPAIYRMTKTPQGAFPEVTVTG
ncbi:MAG: efflux RND transporter permease subunit [Planctomycetales bacterium]|nr:efflux RND transporter permease subunit [Planctomycetales bacterium]